MGGVISGGEAQEEGIILHCPNDHLSKRTTLHSINSSFVVAELLMMHKGSSALLSWTIHASNYSQENVDSLIPGDTLAGSN